MRQRLDRLTRDGQPLPQPSPPRLGTSGCLTGTGGEGSAREKKPTDVTFFGKSGSVFAQLGEGEGRGGELIPGEEQHQGV